jgi:hypothetical protein
LCAFGSPAIMLELLQKDSSGGRNIGRRRSTPSTCTGPAWPQPPNMVALHRARRSRTAIIVHSGRGHDCAPLLAVFGFIIELVEMSRRLHLLRPPRARCDTTVEPLNGGASTHWWVRTPAGTGARWRHQLHRSQPLLSMPSRGRDGAAIGGGSILVLLLRRREEMERKGMKCSRVWWREPVHVLFNRNPWLTIRSDPADDVVQGPGAAQVHPSSATTFPT